MKIINDGRVEAWEVCVNKHLLCVINNPKLFTRAGGRLSGLAGLPQFPSKDNEAACNTCSFCFHTLIQFSFGTCFSFSCSQQVTIPISKGTFGELNYNWFQFQFLGTKNSKTGWRTWEQGRHLVKSPIWTWFKGNIFRVVSCNLNFISFDFCELSL